MPFHRLTLLLPLVLVIACDSSDPMPTDSGMPDAGPRADGGGDSALPPLGDGNDTFADADPITVGPDPTAARIGVPGDQDYYEFDGMAGDWIWLTTDTVDPGGDIAYADCVLQLFDSSMTLIAENDDAIPRGVLGTETDSEIIIRLPQTGTYYAMVQEFSQWWTENHPAEPPVPYEGNADYLYSLIVTPLDDSLDPITVETEMGSTPMTTADVGVSVYAGTLENGTDVDAYAFPVMFRWNASFQLVPIGPMGNGSTNLPGRMWVTNADGSEIIARIDDISMLDTINPPLPDRGDYRFYLDAPSSVGANPFYVVKSVRVGLDNPAEMQEATNGDGDPLTPEVLTQAPDATVMTQREAFVLADLPVGDTDWFQFEVMTGENVNVACGSRTAGSGIQDLQAQVYPSSRTTDPGVVALETATETATETLVISDLVAAPGTYLLRLDRGAQTSDVTGTWVRCGIVVSPPAMM